MTANAHRGEVPLSLQGQDFILRPSFEALVATEEALGASIVEVAARLFDGRPPKLMEVAVIIAEGVKAYGKAANLASLAHVSADGMARLIFDEGVASPAVSKALGAYLGAAISGGAKAGKQGESAGNGAAGGSTGAA